MGSKLEPDRVFNNADLKVSAFFKDMWQGVSQHVVPAPCGEELRMT
jgi:hypothetical protein